MSTKSINPLRLDPTRTVTIRNKFVRDMRVRFNTLKGKINRLVIVEDAFGLKKVSHNPFVGNRLSGTFEEAFKTVSTVLNTRWKFNTTTQQLQQFTIWLQAQIMADVLQGEDPSDTWLKNYIQETYAKGLGRGYEDTMKSKYYDKSLDFYQGTREEFLRSSFGKPASLEKVKLLASRTYTDLKGVTQAMSQQMGRVLVDGLIQGLSPYDIAKNLNNRISAIGIARAETIARTEIIRAHAEGALDAMEALGVEEIGVAVEWSTTEDAKVCPLCAPLEGIVLTLAEARGMFPRHPNCRCSPIPAGLGEDGSMQKRTKGQISKAILKSVQAENPKRTAKQQQRQSKWVGAGKRIATKRPESLVDNGLPLPPLARRMLLNAYWRSLVANNCGTGSGGFKPGNTCAKGGGGTAVGGAGGMSIGLEDDGGGGSAEEVKLISKNKKLAGYHPSAVAQAVQLLKEHGAIMKARNKHAKGSSEWQRLENIRLASVKEYNDVLGKKSTKAVQSAFNTIESVKKQYPDFGKANNVGEFYNITVAKHPHLGAPIKHVKTPEGIQQLSHGPSGFKPSGSFSTPKTPFTQPKAPKVESDHGPFSPSAQKKWAASLSNQEKAGMSAWFDGMYKEYRKYAAGVTQVSSEHQAKYKAFLSALEKAPVYKGTVYRGIRIYGEKQYPIVEQIKAAGVGGTWMEKSPMSTSRSHSKAQGFSAGMANTGIVMHITSKTARQVETLSGYQSEQEVIGMPGTTYKITNIVEHGQYKLTVHMEEL